MGTLGIDYQGYFEVGDREQLAILLEKTELESVFYNELKAQCARVAHLVEPKHERQAWHDLVKELFVTI